MEYKDKILIIRENFFENIDFWWNNIYKFNCIYYPSSMIKNTRIIIFELYVYDFNT